MEDNDNRDHMDTANQPERPSTSAGRLQTTTSSLSLPTNQEANMEYNTSFPELARRCPHDLRIYEPDLDIHSNQMDYEQQRDVEYDDQRALLTQQGLGFPTTAPAPITTSHPSTSQQGFHWQPRHHIQASPADMPPVMSSWNSPQPQATSDADNMTGWLPPQGYQ